MKSKPWVKFDSLRRLTASRLFELVNDSLSPRFRETTTEGTMAHFDLTLTLGFFLIITGIITWAALAILGVFQAFSILEKVMNAIDANAHRRRLLRIYRS